LLRITSPRTCDDSLWPKSWMTIANHFCEMRYILSPLGLSARHLQETQKAAEQDPPFASKSMVDDSCASRLSWDNTSERNMRSPLLLLHRLGWMTSSLFVVQCSKSIVAPQFDRSYSHAKRSISCRRAHSSCLGEVTQAPTKGMKIGSNDT
jgi:hypothetical protein